MNNLPLSKQQRLMFSDRARSMANGACPRQVRGLAWLLMLATLADCGGGTTRNRGAAGGAGATTGDGGTTGDDTGGTGGGGAGGSALDAGRPRPEPDAALDTSAGAEPDVAADMSRGGADGPPDMPGNDDRDGGSVVNGIQHPGLVSSEAELNRMRAIVNGAAAHPMKDGWAKLRSTRFANLAYQPTPFAIVHVVGSGSNAEEAAIRNDGVAAYAHAVQWAVLEDPQYAAKAIEIMRAWSGMLQDVVPATAADPSVQDKLEVAWYAPQWLNAAEIIRYHRNGAAGWSAADRGAFDKMVAIFKKKADAWAGSVGCCPNQGISVALSRLSIGVYTSDKAYFDAAVKFFTGTMLPRAIAASGEVIEINRSPGGDCSHATYNVEGIFDIAETAWHQGTDVYANALLPKGLEYFAQLLTSGAQTTSEGMVTCTTHPDSIEIAYNHYANRARMPSLPHTQVLLGKLRPTDQGTGKFIPWDTLTHAELDAGNN
jgi:hypothetical protein